MTGELDEFGGHLDTVVGAVDGGLGRQREVED